MEKTYIIIPGCCDLNRGDQSLGWETCRIAKEAGFLGKYSILAERGEPIEQSIEEGYEILVPVLEHPSRKFTNKDNIVYDNKTKLKWGFIAIKDFIYSMALFNPVIRKCVKKRGKDKKKIETLKSFEAADAIFMKGGGLIQSHGGLMSTYATYYRLYHIFLAQAIGKKVYILPNSFGPLKGPFVKWMVRNALKNCKLVTTREKQSQKVVKDELKLDIQCYPDLAFFLENGRIDDKLFECKLNIRKERKIVAITMRPYRFPNSEEPEKDYIKFQNELRDFIGWLYEKSYMPLIIEHTFAITTHENDGDCIRDVINGLDKEKYRILSDRSMNCRQLKSVYGKCDYIVGTRFHSLIFSLSNSVPGIAISYDGYKSIGIMSDMKLGNYVIDIGNVTSDTLKKKFNDVIKNEDVIKNNISKYIKEANYERTKLIELMKK